LDQANKAGGDLILPKGATSVELKNIGPTWNLVFQTEKGEVAIAVSDLIRGAKLLERAQASLASKK